MSNRVGKATRQVSTSSTTCRQSLGIGGSRVSFRNREAAGVPLLLLNGVGAEHRLWNNLRRYIDRPTMAFDVHPRQMGFRPSMRTFATTVSSMLDDLGLEQVDVLGLSWGGMAAQQLAHDYPHRIRRLVLASTTPGFVAVPAKPTSTMALLWSSRSAKRAEGLSRHLYGGDFLNDPTLIHRLGLIRPVDGPTYRRQMLAITGWSSLPWLNKISHKTLILHGDDDPIVPFVNARLMSRLIPDATLHRVQQGGHLYLYTRPEVHGRQISDFLSTANGARSPGRAVTVA